MTVGLQTFEAFLSIVQNGCARIHLQRRIRLDAAVSPAFALGPSHVGHVVGEDLTECRLVDELLALRVGCGIVVRQHGERLGELVQRGGIVMIVFCHNHFFDNVAVCVTAARWGSRRFWHRL